MEHTMQIKISRVVLVSFALLTGLFAEAFGEASFLGGLAIPQQTFAEDTKDGVNGFANLGYCAGIEYSSHLTIPILSLCGGVSLLYHPLDKKRLDDIMLYDSLKGGDYLTVPLLIGGKASIPFAGIELYGLAQAGMGLFYRLDLSGSQKLSRIHMTTGYEPAITFAHLFGAGIDFDGNFKVSVRYLNLGSPEFQFDRTLKGSPVSTGGTVSFDASCLMIVLEMGM
jgi:hypothetical protein